MHKVLSSKLRGKTEFGRYFIQPFRNLKKPNRLFNNDLEIYCITTSSATHRHKRVVKELHKVGLLKNCIFQINRYPMDLEGRLIPDGISKSSKLTPCAYSHMACLYKFQQGNAKACLIFEDDVCFKLERITKQSVTDVQTFLFNYDFDVFFLGCFPFHFSEHELLFPTIRKTIATQAHAYIVSRRGSNIMLKYMEKERNHSNVNDNFPAMNVKCYMVSPMWCFQTGYASSNFQNWPLIGKLVNWLFTLLFSGKITDSMSDETVVNIEYVMLKTGLSVISIFIILVIILFIIIFLLIKGFVLLYSR